MTGAGRGASGVVLAAAVPLLVAVARGGELMFRFHHRTTQAERRRNYLYMLLSGKDAAKELRAFGLGDFLRERFDRLYDEHLVELRKVARQRLRVSLLGNLPGSSPPCSSWPSTAGSAWPPPGPPPGPCSSSASG